MDISNKILDDNRRNEFLEKIVPYILKVGVKELRTEGLLTHLGVSRRTLYQHFKNKEEIIHVAINHVFEEIIVHVNEHQSINELDQLILKITKSLRGVDHHFLEELWNYRPELYYFLLSKIDEVLSGFKKMYKTLNLKTDYINSLANLDRLFILDLVNQNRSEKKLIKEIELYLTIKFNSLADLT